MSKKGIVEKVHDVEKKKRKKKLKRAVRRIVFGVLGGTCLLCTGYFLGVHHRVIEAWIKGEELPAPPKGHCCH